MNAEGVESELLRIKDTLAERSRTLAKCQTYTDAN